MQNYISESSYAITLNAEYNNRNFIKKPNSKNEGARFIAKKDQIISLSNREFQCVKLLAHGKRVKEIARYLEISHRTVEHYLMLVKEKTACNYHEQLVDFYWVYVEQKSLDI